MAKKVEAAKATKVEFKMTAPQAKNVSVAGSFNQWQPQAMKSGAKGAWKVGLSLAPGNYEYKFVVDGSWIHDPCCPDSQSDNHGGVNSVLKV